MPKVEVNQLYNYKRFPESGYLSLCFCLYLPFGLMLFLLRLVIGLQVFLLGFVLPDLPIFRQILTKLLCVTLGITVCVKNPDRKEDVEFFVSNSISPLDYLVTHTVTTSVTPGTNKFNSLLGSALGIHHFGNPSGNFEEFKKTILAFMSQNICPLYFQPEWKVTNGKALLKFKLWPFGLSGKIQPIVLQVSRPFLGLSINTLGSNYWIDIFYYMLLPYTIYKLSYLPIIEKSTLSEEEFAEKIRLSIATALQIEACDYTAADLQEWEKRYNLEQQRSRAVQQTTMNIQHNQLPELQRMTRQVKEVLPLVPYNVIYRDIVKTRSVDVTITNILEGHISYQPETPPVASLNEESAPVINTGCVSASAKINMLKSSQSDLLCISASSFGKSAQERTLSFQERKRQLMENARTRYIEKHGLGNVVLNNC